MAAKACVCNVYLEVSGGLAGSSPSLKSNMSARVFTDNSSAPDVS